MRCGEKRKDQNLQRTHNDKKCAPLFLPPSPRLGRQWPIQRPVAEGYSMAISRREIAIDGRQHSRIPHTVVVSAQSWERADECRAAERSMHLLLWIATYHTSTYPSEHVVVDAALVTVVQVSREVLCKILYAHSGIRTYVGYGVTKITVNGSARFPVGPKSSFRSRSPKSNRNDRNSAEFRRKIQPSLSWSCCFGYGCGSLHTDT